MLFPSTFKPVSVSVDAQLEGGRRPRTRTKIFSLHHSPALVSAQDRRVLVLLHGFPQNHTLFYEAVSELSKTGMLEEWDVVIPDLPGYGASTKIPSIDGSHSANSKRSIASDIVALIDSLFGSGQQFIVAGHDRGARVAYRMAKDHRSRVLGLCLMEIIPTKMMFERMNSSDNHSLTHKAYHWIFLAHPPPIPETLIGASSDFYFSHTIEMWTGPRHRGHLDPIAVASWVEQYRNPAVITGSLEDYRAGASIDLEHDEEDESQGKAAVDCPLLIFHSQNFGQRFDLKAIWEPLGTKGVAIKEVGDEDVGHFIPVEAASECIAELVPWLKSLHAA